MTQQAFDDLAENFALLDDWEERYRYVIELGKEMPPLDEARKTDGTIVDGCVSRVWLDERIRQTPDGDVLDFEGDSDAFIVKGLIAVLHTLVSGRSPQEVADLDIEGQLRRIDLASHLSPQRSNGLNAMIKRIRRFSESHLNASA